MNDDTAYMNTIGSFRQFWLCNYLIFFNLSFSKLRTWARKDVVQRTKFALDIGAKLFKFFENYFQIKYPMEKIGKHVIFLSAHMFLSSKFYSDRSLRRF